MQRPVHPSYGRVKQNVDGCLFAWTGNKKTFFKFLCITVSSTQDCSEHFTRHVIVILYCFAKAVHMSNDRQNVDPA